MLYIRFCNYVNAHGKMVLDIIAALVAILL